jgi:hypothetical protein
VTAPRGLQGGRARLLSLLSRVLGGSRSPESVPGPVMVAMSCNRLLDDLIDRRRPDIAIETLRARYEELFRDTAIGLYEDGCDGVRKMLPRGFLHGLQGRSNGAILTRYLVEEVLRVPIDGQLPRRVTQAVFNAHGLSGVLGYAFRGAPWEALESAYPGRFHPWEFRKSPTNYWQGSEGRARAIRATRWLFETRLRWSDADIRERCHVQTFYDHGVGGMLATVFGASPWKALEAAYPGRFRPWELAMTSTDFWAGPEAGAHAVRAVRWLIEERLGWTEEQVRRQLTRSVFARHGLGGLLGIRYGASPWKALEEAYPGRYRPWQLTKSPQAYWRGRAGRERAVVATRWLIEERLQWDDATAEHVHRARPRRNAGHRLQRCRLGCARGHVSRPVSQGRPLRIRAPGAEPSDR